MEFQMLDFREPEFGTLLTMMLNLCPFLSLKKKLKSDIFEKY